LQRLCQQRRAARLTKIAAILRIVGRVPDPRVGVTTLR
jgi:hypothetical protein